jgi:hypothetical protein
MVAGSYAPPVLQLCEQVFDFVADPVQRLVVIERDLAVSGWGNAGGDPAAVGGRMLSPTRRVKTAGNSERRAPTGGKFR